MPDLLDRIYCSEQIHIPPTFPYIMKLYCKAAIRTQPYDLLRWSAAYFRALANGEEPPVKERIEYPPYNSPCGLTPGYIKMLINQFGKDPHTTITAQTLFKKWSDACLQEQLLIRLIALLGAVTTVNWVKFVGVCAGFISRSLTQTMTLICELFTEEPEGGMATIPFDLFVDLYIYLAQMECGPLTDQEREELDAIMEEEDICHVADRIKEGIYEGEAEEELPFAGEAGEALTMEICEHGEKSTIIEEEISQRIGDDSLSGEDIKDKSENTSSRDEDYDVYSVQLSEKESVKDVTSSQTVIEDREGEYAQEGEGGSLITKESFEEKTEEAEEKREEKAAEVEVAEAKPKTRKINLDDMEQSIRGKIEARLAEDEESYMDEQEQEFEELSSYLLGAAARVQKYTAEILGYKIFKKYLRQDVPGIGPAVGSEQVEKVVDFMDFWSNKQGRMVMPRNIRHWMCPPLDKLPAQEP